MSDGTATMALGGSTYCVQRIKGPKHLQRSFDAFPNPPTSDLQPHYSGSFPFSDTIRIGSSRRFLDAPRSPYVRPESLAAAEEVDVDAVGWHHLGRQLELPAEPRRVRRQEDGVQAEKHEQI